MTMMNNYLKEIKAIAIFILIALIIVGFIYILVHFKLEMLLYKSILFYLVLSLMIAIIGNFTKSKVFQIISRIILFPAGLMLIIGTIILPIGFLFIHVFYYFIFTFLVPELFFFVTKYFKILFIKNQVTLVYMKFTLSVFLAVLFNYQLRKIIYKISPARLKTSEKLKPYQLDKLTDYLLSENNVRFLIYSTYVLLLVTINFYNFEGYPFSKELINDKAILQSFVSFIAFDRSLNLLKQLEFKPSDFLSKITESIIRKFKDLDKKNIS